MIRTLLGILAGAATLVLGVMVTTWGALAMTGLSMDSEPTGPYLALNLIGSLVAAIAAGWVATAVARGHSAAAWVVAALIVGMTIPGLFEDAGPVQGAQAAVGQPGWYPLVVSALGLVGVAAGAAMAVRSARRIAGADMEE